MLCRCCRAIEYCDLNVSAGRTQQSNHRVTYIMKHPLLSSLSRPLYCVKQYRTDSLASCKTQTHNIQNRYGLKVTWHHWPSSIWTLLCCTLHRRWQCLDQEIWLRLIVERPCCPLPKTNINIAASLSAAVNLDHFPLLPAHDVSRHCQEIILFF